jgi:hypothetical protein
MTLIPTQVTFRGLAHSDTFETYVGASPEGESARSP